MRKPTASVGESYPFNNDGNLDTATVIWLRGRGQNRAVGYTLASAPARREEVLMRSFRDRVAEGKHLQEQQARSAGKKKEE